jgi:NADH-quinone oxidoreductase subunit D
MNNHACALTVEKGLQIEVPERAEVIRIIISELTRLASHQLWWGSVAMDLGALSPFFYAFREREMITDIMEETCGARLNHELYGTWRCYGRYSSNFSKESKRIYHPI